MNLRKISFTKETTFADAGKPTAHSITRAVAVAIIGSNPFAAHFVEDLPPLFAQRAELGALAMKDLVALMLVTGHTK
jgi:hypothetical protein